MSHNDHLTGIERIAAAFQQAHTTQTAALMPYYTLGYPDRERSLEVIQAIAPYADLLELGVPFSDPIADGPTIQRTTQKSLEAGTTLAGCLEMMRELRQQDVTIPVLLMGYVNPMMAYGEERLVRDAAAAGVDGFIVPDLPLEEASFLGQLCIEAGLALISFLAPTTDPQRMEKILGQAKGFVYMVSVTGITGARRQLANNLPAFVSQIKAKSPVPVAVGFGISTPEQAAAVGQFADGVIVGSALINAVDEGGEAGAAAAARFVQVMKEAIRL
ncbi:MAG: tryptophan synthase subunit alpha [Anaerolineae bacterium]|nr:tryptophan synthase subunit alpha [Anaerolineae bacterium]